MIRPMEETTKAPERRRSSYAYAILASFLLGSFAGSAFGVLFALSLDQDLTPWRQVAIDTSSPRKTVLVEDAQVIEAVRRVAPAVVSVGVFREVAPYNRTGPFPFEEFFEFGLVPQPAPAPQAGKPIRQQVGGGTGFVISADGLILTNKHVAVDDGAEYEVTMSDGKTYPAKALARDAVLDLAVLKIEAAGLPVVELGDSDALQIGETVVAIGNALSEYRNTVTKGVISGINRRVVAGNGFGTSEVLEEALQTDAAINPGNSGGPLIDLRGRVIGVNTAVNRAGQSIGFAIPVNAAKVVIESVQRHGRIVRPWLGVRYVLLDKEIAEANGLATDHGAMIVAGRNGEPAVLPDSPADKAGILADDVLIEVDGQAIGPEHPLSSLIARKRAGDAVTITLLRKGERKALTVVLGELPEVK